MRHKNTKINFYWNIEDSDFVKYICEFDFEIHTHDAEYDKYALNFKHYKYCEPKHKLFPYKEVCIKTIVWKE